MTERTHPQQQPKPATRVPATRASALDSFDSPSAAATPSEAAQKPPATAGEKKPTATAQPSVASSTRTQAAPTPRASQEAPGAAHADRPPDGASESATSKPDADSGKPRASKPSVDQLSKGKPTAGASDAGRPEAGEPEPEAEANPDQPGANDAAAEKPRKRRGKVALIAFIVVIALLLAAALVAFGLFTWNRWNRFDDAADMQGKWYAAGTSTPITIEQDLIWFDEDTAYAYYLDDETKTITYSLGNLQGEGHYWFSDGRSCLTITEGTGFDKWDTALGDLKLDIGAWFTSVTGGEQTLPEGDGIISLSRTPGIPSGSAPTADEKQFSSASEKPYDETGSQDMQDE